MASNKRRPVVGNLLTSGHRCPSSPLKILSPTGIINCDLAVVGLAIVAALQNTTTTSQINQPPKHHHPSYANLFYDDVGGETHERKASNVNKRREMCVFDISPTVVVDHIKCYPPPDFLTCCHLCNKKLHGKDIYMYRGEKAFCSIECRSRKMRMDERRENHCNMTRVVSGSSSQSHAHILSTGIFAL